MVGRGEGSRGASAVVVSYALASYALAVCSLTLCKTCCGQVTVKMDGAVKTERVDMQIAGAQD